MVSLPPLAGRHAPGHAPYSSPLGDSLYPQITANTKMTALAATGYCLFAFGPITALFFGTVACNPHEVILLILG